MKRSKLIQSDWVVIATALISTLITTISAIYTSEIKTIMEKIFDHWRLGVLCISILILLWRLSHILIRNKVLRELDSKFANIESINTQLDEAKEFNSRTSVINTRVVRDILIPRFVRTDKDIESFAKDLYRSGFTAPELALFPFDQKITQAFMRVYHEEKLKENKAGI